MKASRRYVAMSVPGRPGTPTAWFVFDTRSHTTLLAAATRQDANRLAREANEGVQ